MFCMDPLDASYDTERPAWELKGGILRNFVGVRILIIRFRGILELSISYCRGML